MANERQVDLVVRAKDVEAKPLADLLKLVDQLGAGLGDLAKSGGPATRTVRELSTVVGDFATVAKELATRRALVEGFTQLKEGAAGAAVDLAKAKEALEAYKAGLEGVKKRSEEQRETLAKLKKEYNAAERAVNSFAKRQKSSEEALAGIGVAAADAAAELIKLRDIEARVDGMSVQAERNLRGRDAAVRAAKEEAEAKKQAADATRAQIAAEDALLAIQNAAQAELLARGKVALAQEQSAIKEAEQLSARLANQRIADAKRAEQAEHDRLALIQQAAQAEQRRRGSDAMAGELASIREAEALTKRLADERAQADAAEAKRKAELLAFDKAIGAQKEASIAASRQEADDLRKLADGARATLVEYDKLVAAVKELQATPAVQSLTRQIAELSQPAQQAAVSLDQLRSALPAIEHRQRAAADAAELNSKETKQLAQDYTLLEGSLRTLGSAAGAIDGFRKQQTELERVAAALDDARAKLQAFEQQAAQGIGGHTVLSGIGEQQRLIATLSQEYQRLGIRVADARQLLEAMGIEAAQLDQVEKELLATTQRVRSAFDAAGDASTRLGQATSKGVASMRDMRSETESAVSSVRAMGRQVLALAAAYTGMYSVINEGQRTLDAAKTLQAVNARIGVAFGDDPKVIAGELDYVRGVADRLGMSLADAAEGYSKFAIAGRAAGFQANDTRYVFEKFSEVSRVYNLSIEETSGVFKALEQILSKGKVQAEELRGQLGDRLSGAFYQFANSLGITTQQLDKLLETGKVPADFLLLFAKQFGASVKDQVEPASKSFTAQVARMNTALFDFRNAVSEAGFLDAMTELAAKLTEFLKSADGADAAETLAAAFRILAQAGAVLVDVLGGSVSALKSLGEAGATVKGLFEGMFDAADLPPFVRDLWNAADSARALGEALVFVGTVGAVNVTIAKLTTLVSGLTGATSAATLAVRLLGTTIKGLLWPAMVVLVGIDVFRWAEKNFSWAAKVSILLETVFQKLEAIGKFLLKPIPVGGLGKALDDLKTKLAKIDEVQSEGLLKVEQEATGSVILPRNARGRVTLAPNGAGGGRGSVNPEQAGTVLDSSREDALRAQAAALGNQPDKEAAAAAKRALTDARTLLKQVETATRELEVSAAKRSADEATEAARAIDLQYSTLLENIARVGELTKEQLAQLRKEAKTPIAEAATPAELEKALRARVEASKQQLKERAAEKLATKQAKEKLEALIAERDALIDVEKLQAKLNPDDAERRQQNVVTLLEQYRDRIVEAADAAADLAEKQKNVADAAKLRATGLTESARGSDREQKAAKLEDDLGLIQKLTGERDARLNLVDARLSAGQIDDTGALQERVSIMEQYRDSIGKAAASARGMAEALQNPAMVANMDALLLKLQQTNEQSVRVGESFRTDFGSALVDAALAGSEALGQIVVKGGDINDVFDATGKVFANFAATFLKQVASMILQTYALAAAQAVLKAVGFGFGGGAGASTGGATMSGTATLGNVAHTGGVVGSVGTWRNVSSQVFEGAQRYHEGTQGVPIGLKADEVPAILQKGEEVLSKNDPRNILNGGGGGQSVGVKAVIVDDERKAIEHLHSSENEKAFLTFAKRNAPTIRRIISS